MYPDTKQKHIPALLAFSHLDTTHDTMLLIKYLGHIYYRIWIKFGRRRAIACTLRLDPIRHNALRNTAAHARCPSGRREDCDC
eukprot:6172886-Pleurochrysis_carterae.AAC.4